MTKNRESWIKRFWRWLTGPIGELEDEPQGIPAAPEALPPKEELPQGSLFQLLQAASAPRLLASNHPARAKASIQVYDYCGVVFPKADQVYHYLNTDASIRVGDRVLVPVHVHGEHKMAEGMVVSSGEYLAQCVPYPVADTSYIIKKLS